MPSLFVSITILSYLKLHEFCVSLNLIPVNLSPVCKNPQFTYFFQTENSIVYHVIIDDAALETVDRSSEHPDNTVHHLPLKICLSINDSDRRVNDIGNHSFNTYDKIPRKRCTLNNWVGIRNI